MPRDTFKLTIKVGDDAMKTAHAISYALEDVARKLRSGKTEGAIMDTNGNRVGQFEAPRNIER